VEVETPRMLRIGHVRALQARAMEAGLETAPVVVVRRPEAGDLGR